MKLYDYSFACGTPAVRKEMTDEIHPSFPHCLVHIKTEALRLFLNLQCKNIYCRPVFTLSLHSVDFMSIP